MHSTAAAPIALFGGAACTRAAVAGGERGRRGWKCNAKARVVSIKFHFATWMDFRLGIFQLICNATCAYICMENPGWASGRARVVAVDMRMCMWAHGHIRLDHFNYFLQCDVRCANGSAMHMALHPKTPTSASTFLLLRFSCIQLDQILY